MVRINCGIEPSALSDQHLIAENESGTEFVAENYRTWG